MIYLILPLNRNKLNNHSVSKLGYKYFDINVNATIIIAKSKTIHWKTLWHGINGLCVLGNKYNKTIMTKMFTST